MLPSRDQPKGDPIPHYWAPDWCFWGCRKTSHLLTDEDSKYNRQNVYIKSARIGSLVSESNFLYKVLSIKTSLKLGKNLNF